jgi:hypothetical protein
VNAVNSTPVPAVMINQTISQGFLLVITNRVTDFDLPPNRIHFHVGANRPTGVTYNATKGIFRWQPDSTHGPSANLFTVIATDNGTPSLGATQNAL